MLRAALLACAAAIALTAAGPVAAQSADPATERAAVFAQMLANPSDRDLMRRYASLSVQMRDFEAAASTLERLVDLEPGNAAARIELAIAYFGLGSYAVAQYHLAVAEGSGVLTPDQAAEVARYRAAASGRDSGRALSGRLEAGYAFPQVSGEDGLFLSAAIDWRLDLDGPNAAQWVTEFGLSSFQPGQGSLNQRTIGRIRSGPEFRIAGDAYGPRLQPFVEVEWIDRDPILVSGLTTWAVGAAYRNPINESFTLYSDAALGRGLPESDFVPEFTFHEVNLGVTWRPSRETRLRLGLRLEEQEEQDTFFPQTTTIAGARLTAQHAFDPGFLDLPNRWLVGGFADVEETAIANDFFRTDIEETSYGVWLRAFVVEDIYLELGASQLTQDTTSFGFTTTTEETVYTVQVGWEF